MARWDNVTPAERRAFMRELAHTRHAKRTTEEKRAHAMRMVKARGMWQDGVYVRSSMGRGKRGTSPQ